MNEECTGEGEGRYRLPNETLETVIDQYKHEKVVTI